MRRRDIVRHKNLGWGVVTDVGEYVTVLFEDKVRKFRLDDLDVYLKTESELGIESTIQHRVFNYIDIKGKLTNEMRQSFIELNKENEIRLNEYLKEETRINQKLEIERSKIKTELRIPQEREKNNDEAYRTRANYLNFKKRRRNLSKNAMRIFIISCLFTFLQLVPDTYCPKNYDYDWSNDVRCNPINPILLTITSSTAIISLSVYYNN